MFSPRCPCVSQIFTVRMIREGGHSDRIHVYIHLTGLQWELEAAVGCLLWDSLHPPKIPAESHQPASKSLRKTWHLLLAPTTTRTSKLLAWVKPKIYSTCLNRRPGEEYTGQHVCRVTLSISINLIEQLKEHGREERTGDCSPTEVAAAVTKVATAMQNTNELNPAPLFLHGSYTGMQWTYTTHGREVPYHATWASYTAVNWNLTYLSFHVWAQHLMSTTLALQQCPHPTRRSWESRVIADCSFSGRTLACPQQQKSFLTLYFPPALHFVFSLPILLSDRSPDLPFLLFFLNTT